jgi:hypothetical protein
MCIVYNTIGALSHIESQLSKNNFDEFNSISDLINFEKNYSFTEEQIILKHRLSVQKEKKVLEDDIAILINEISKYKSERNEKLKLKLDNLNQQLDKLFLPKSNLLTIFKDIGLNIIVWTKIWSAPTLTRANIFITSRKQNKVLLQKNIRYDFVKNDFENAVNQSSSNELQNLSQKRIIIKELKSFIYGAIGEHKVETALLKLSDEYILINDFTCYFQPPMFNSKEKDYIKSIQIDHIVISPSGVFIIETKNWSENSIQNIDMRSPVKQVHRTNFALFKLLANNTLKDHHWGKRRIPIKNIIAFINHKPLGEFEYVKILSLNELVKYITYFPPCISKEEVAYIADYLLKYCVTKDKPCKLSIQ